jgi:hypothetical protein
MSCELEARTLHFWTGMGSFTTGVKDMYHFDRNDTDNLMPPSIQILD